MYKNSHTTSTKCQYQAAHSKLVRCNVVVFILFIRINLTVKKVVPINTCKPWNPVAIKKVLPYTESAIENEASVYSNPCKQEKVTPSKIVVNKEILLFKLCFSNL
jgi:hypothetical protein